MNVRFFYDHFTLNRAAYWVLFSALILYGTLSYRISVDTSIFKSSYDCILTLDTGTRFNLTTLGQEQHDYTSYYHPAFIVFSRPIYQFLALFFEVKTAIWLFMTLCSSATVLLFFKILEKRNINRPLSLTFTALFGCSFSTLLFAHQYDAHLLIGLFTNAFLYLILTRPDWMTRASGFLFLHVLAFGAAISGLIQMIVFPIVYAKEGVIQAAARLARFWLYAVLFTIAAIYFLMAAGINSPFFIHNSDYMRAEQYRFINRHYITNKKPIPDIHNAAEHIAWAAGNLFEPSRYTETFERVLVNPIMAYPIIYKPNRLDDHRCLTFKFAFSWPQLILGLILLPLYLAGLYFAVRSKDRFYIAVAITSVLYVGLYGFAYIPMLTYLYGTQCIALYFILIAYAVQTLLQRYSSTDRIESLIRQGTHTLLLLVLFSVATTNFSNIAYITEFVQKRYSKYSRIFPVGPETPLIGFEGATRHELLLQKRAKKRRLRKEKQAQQLLEAPAPITRIKKSTSN